MTLHFSRFLALLAAFALTMGPISGQQRAFILCEGAQDMVSGEVIEAPRVGAVTWDGETATFEVLHVFTGQAFATDVVLGEDGATLYVAGEDTVYRMDAWTGEVLASQALQGARRLLPVGDRVFVTRGDYDAVTWGSVPFDHYLVALDADDLSWQAGWVSDGTSGPAWSAEGMCSSGGVLYAGINNAFAYGEEVGLIGRVDLVTGSYDEVDLGPEGLNPVHLFATEDGAVVSVNARQYDGTSLSRWGGAGLAQTEAVAEVTAGCGAAAWHEGGVIYQIYGEGGFRRADGGTLAPLEGWSGNGQAVYSMAVVPETGALLGVTDFVGTGTVELRTWDGVQLWSVPVGVAPGRMVVAAVASSVVEPIGNRWKTACFDVLGRPRSMEDAGLSIFQWSDGSVTKEFRAAD